MNYMGGTFVRQAFQRKITDSITLNCIWYIKVMYLGHVWLDGYNANCTQKSK